ncbi:hypothetical protein GKC30_03450 [Pseudodesulfovibrio sp. F-1]|uniref:Uncharacterized protein n=1 Tax=Pseudodesulfovibrio alkaliphilus TaxID=2661613 RepID=A0A7K1KKS5_9BACT|nr:hypothetical protein [Pseudodesulfovibrio alkaliphilus]MUM76686.1 hypothetical protein [Pseudodesulfovibrio alkaliphilus]
MTPADESKSGEPRLSEDIPTLEAEIAALTLEREKTVRTIRELMAAEKPAEGIFHHEQIFELQRDKLRLDVDIQFRVNKINRLNLGIDGLSQSEPGNGFLF